MPILAVPNPEATGLPVIAPGGLCGTMKQLSPQQKHSILTRYRAHSSNHSFAALAAQAGDGLTKSTLHSWYRRWDGTPASLQHRPVTGRPRVLSRGQVAQHVRPRILSANRGARAVHYTTLHHVVERATGKSMSVRTLRRYGHEQLQAKQKRTKKRTAVERKSNHLLMEQPAACCRACD